MDHPKEPAISGPEVGIGLAFGAGIGLIVALMLEAPLPLGLIAGSVIGLLVAVALDFDLGRSGSDSG